MRETICNGLINYNSSNPICICDEMDEDEYDEMYDNTFASEEYLENKEEDYSSEDMYAIW